MTAKSTSVIDTDALSCPAPTPEKLDNLGTGCFVRVHGNDGCYWAEITGTDADHRFTGVIHRELSSNACRTPINDGEQVKFGRDDITLLGCDNHCWC